MSTSKSDLLQRLASLGVSLGYDEDRPAIDLAQYATNCQKAFNLEQKEVTKLLWHMLVIIDKNA